MAPSTPRFPEALRWLADQQLPDGSWGGEVRYRHDRILSTLAALVPLARFDREASSRARLAAGTRFLWQQAHLLAGEPVELVGFELLLPALIERAERVGIPIPPNLDSYGPKRLEKLRLIPPDALYSTRTTAVHSLEFLGEQADLDGLLAAQGANGSIGNSPAATAFYLSRHEDARALAYLESCRARCGGAMVSVLDPCETFELLWAAYHLFLAGVPPERLVAPGDRAALGAALASGGVSLSPTFPIADADDTAVALILLHELGETVDPSCLRKFASPDGHFASFGHERHASVGVNLHVLHALLRVPGYPDVERAVDQLLDYAFGQQIGGLYWVDKWHVSPYYATAHALCVLGELPESRRDAVEPQIERTREWLRQTQNADGSWGFYGQATAEETAYAVLALASADAARVSERDRHACARGAGYLRDISSAHRPGDAQTLPPLWIDKCLYTPTLIVQSVVEAAGLAQRRLRGSRNVPPTRSGHDFDLAGRDAPGAVTAASSRAEGGSRGERAIVRTNPSR